MILASLSAPDVHRDLREVLVLPADYSLFQYREPFISSVIIILYDKLNVK